MNVTHSRHLAMTAVAVLDDYQGCARSHFDKLDPSKYEVAYFPETLLPWSTAPQTVRDELVRRLEPFDVIGEGFSPDSRGMANGTATMRERTPLPAELIERLPRLKLILTNGARNKAIDLDACKARGIPVASAKDLRAGPVDSTTEHAVAMILGIARDLAGNDAAIKAGAWQTGFVTGLSGKTLGLVGLGRLGASVGRIMSLFGMKVQAWSTNLTQEVADEKARDLGLPTEGPDGSKTFKAVSRDELFSTSDVVSVHLVLSDRSRGLITRHDLSQMKPSAFFVNTSRGPLVVEADLLDAIKTRRIAGVAVDVYNIEPLPQDSPWRSIGGKGQSHVLVTPHIAYVEETSISGFYKQQVENLERWTAGEDMQNLLS